MAITLVRGQLYRVRLTNGTWHDARFISEKPATIWGSRKHYLFQNLDSGRDVEIKSMARIKSKIS